MYYLIKETPEPCAESALADAIACRQPFAAVLTPEEWARREAAFDMGIDFEPDINAALDTQAEVNYDSITGTVFIPDRANPDGPEARFAFALDEKGVVFIDAGPTAEALIRSMATAGRTRNPSLEHFLASFLEQIVKADRRFYAITNASSTRWKTPSWTAKSQMTGTFPRASPRCATSFGTWTTTTSI